MATTVFALCAITSAGCAVLLLRGYAANRVRLLWWSGLCFVGLAVNNLLLFVDLVILEDSADLSGWRSAPALAGVLALVYGLVREPQR